MTTPPVKKACDACHRRKVRCSGGLPCNNCSQASLQCTYLAIPQKKGPKGSRAKVISEIRVTQQQSTSPQLTPTIQHDSAEFDFNKSPISPPVSRSHALLSQQTIDHCIDFYFTNMSTTAWILDRHVLSDTLNAQLAVNPEIYCLIASLCAFVMVQPGMNLAVAPGSHHQSEPPRNRYGYANMLLEDILRVRKTIDYVETPTLSSVQTSFFLFSCYFTLEKQNICWFHLREAATLAQLMALHEESTYLTVDAAESISRRRTYWLLLVTERAYAMERHRPLSLHATIDLPAARDPLEEGVISGTIYLVSLFRCIDDKFMSLWNKYRSECSTAWLSRLQQRLIDAIPPELQTTESQFADVKITQHWLRIMVWQLSITNGYLSSSSRDTSMTFKFPIEVARDLLKDISNISLLSMEVHGVGLIEKLFDIACTLTDVIACVPIEPSNADSVPSTNLGGHAASSGSTMAATLSTATSSSSTNAAAATSARETPSDYLNRLVNLISQLRGGASRYLPLLLAKVSENLPSMTAPLNPTPQLNMQMHIKQGYAGALDHIPTPTPPAGALRHMQSHFGVGESGGRAENVNRPNSGYFNIPQTTNLGQGDGLAHISGSTKHNPLDNRLMFHDYSPSIQESTDINMTPDSASSSTATSPYGIPGHGLGTTPQGLQQEPFVILAPVPRSIPMNLAAVDVEDRRQ